MAAAPPSLARHLLLPAGCLLLLLLTADAARLPLALAPDDADALLQLKSGIKDGGGALSSWAPGTSPCNGDESKWAGVMCNKNGVHGLQLEGMSLSGKLDLGALKRLSGLRTLSFMDNEFAGPMPDVRGLSGLRAIFLSGNEFSGTIPADAFGGMGWLKKIVLSNNNFSGPIPASLADLPRLLDLQLNDNKFQGKIPDLKQKELKDVNLANNELEGEIPASLKNIKSDMFAGNKKLCGAPLGAKCEATPPPAVKAPVPTSDKAGAAPDAAASTGASADDGKQEVQKPAEGFTSYGILAAVLGTLAIAGVAFVALHKRRDTTKNFGPAASTKPSGPRVEPQPAAKAEASAARGAASAAAGAAAAAAAGGGGEERSSRAGGSTARKVELGRLTFVRDDRGRFFELQDLLKATAEVLGTANLGVCYRATLTSGHSVVVKRFKEMNRVGREDFEEHMRRLGRLSHPNLLRLVAYYYRKEEKLLIHERGPRVEESGAALERAAEDRQGRGAGAELPVRRAVHAHGAARPPQVVQHPAQRPVRAAAHRLRAGAGDEPVARRAAHGGLQVPRAEAVRPLLQEERRLVPRPAHPRDPRREAGELRPPQGGRGGRAVGGVVVPAEAGGGGQQQRPGERRELDAGGRVAARRGGPGPEGRGRRGQGGDGEADQDRHGVLRDQRGQPVGAQDRRRQDRGAQGDGPRQRGPVLLLVGERRGGPQ
ncbi:hypothetical protein GQ55_6G254400 [Panicum hallii var. hallii]|uniref:Leucine-rich repeat-containing N-terminal plant-type domain-containing protein n=1 Tax=Panicum hallii var. hallii TaxID=1504633 RepID=A0A2T7D9N5_9POAL|nr:hypothetical protein GQ55_6G254400 [Panicum hallii var. hallii]